MGSLWQYSTIHNSACKIIEEQTLWGQTVCRVWLPNQDAVGDLEKLREKALLKEFEEYKKVKKTQGLPL